MKNKDINKFHRAFDSFADSIQMGEPTSKHTTMKAIDLIKGGMSLKNTAWLPGLGEVFGKNAFDLNRGDTLVTPFGGTEIIGSMVAKGETVTFSTSWKDVNGKAYTTTHEKQPEEVIPVEFGGQVVGTDRNKAQHDLKLPMEESKIIIKTINYNEMKAEFKKLARARFGAFSKTAKEMKDPIVLAAVLKKVKNNAELQKQFDSLDVFVENFNEEFAKELAKVKKTAPATKKSSVAEEAVAKSKATKSQESEKAAAEKKTAPKDAPKSDNPLVGVTTKEEFDKAVKGKKVMRKGKNLEVTEITHEIWTDPKDSKDHACINFLVGGKKGTSFLKIASRYLEVV